MSVSGFLGSLSIPRKLLLLLLIIFLPASGIIVASSLVHWKHAIRDAEEDALLLVQSLATQQEQITHGIKQMLSTLAQLPEVHRQDASACNELFKTLNKMDPFYSTITAMTPDGAVFAASAPFDPGGVNVSDRKYFKDAISTLDFSAGEYIVGRVSRVPSINFIYPVFDANNNLVAFMGAGLRVDEYAHFLTKANLSEGSVFVITDYKGVRLFRFPANDSVTAGRPVPEDAFQVMAGDREQGIFERTSEDGVNRFYAFKQLRLRESSSPYLYMIVGIDKGRLFKAAGIELLGYLSGLGILALLTMLFAWISANRLLILPINQLVATTRRLGKGELGTRTGLPHTPDELGLLAESFDEMGSLLEIKSNERTLAEEELQKAHDELDAKVEVRTAALARANDSLKMEVAERGKVEEALRAALTWAEDEKSRSESVITSLTDGLIIVDRDFNVVYQNEIGKVHMGSHMGERCYSAFYHRDHICEQCPVVKCFVDGNLHKLELSREINGKILYLDVAASPIRKATGEITGAIEIARDITERKQAEQAIRQSEVRYRTLFETATDAIFLIRDDRFIDCNESASRMFGANRNELIDSYPYAFSPPVQPDGTDSQEEATKRLADALSGVPQFFEWKHCRLDGTPFDAEVNLNRIELGDEILILGIVRNITDRKLSERALQESAAFQQRLIDALPAPVFYKDSEGRFLGCNCAYERFLNISKDEIVGKSVFDIAPGEPAGVYHQTDLALSGNPNVLVYESSIGGADGSVHDVIFHKATFSKPDGSLGGFIWAILDITERKQAEEELRRSEERLKILFECAPDPYFLTEPEGRIVDANKASEDVSGYAKEELIGKTIFELDMLLPEDVGRAAGLLAQNGLGHPTGPDEFMLKRKDGTPVFMEVRAIPTVIGGQTLALGIARDITERKRTEEALIESQQQLADIINFLPDATFVIDIGGRVIAWNRAMEEMLGVRAEAVLGKGDYEYALHFYGERRPILIDLVLEPQEEIEAKYVNLVRKGSVLAGDAYIPAIRDGKSYFVGTASALYDSKGNIVGAIESIRDVTERRLMQEALVRTEGKYRDIFENSVTGIYQVSPDGRFLSLNTTIARILGYDSPAEVLEKMGDATQAYVKPERRSELLRLIKEQGSAREFEVEFFRKDGSIVWISLDVRAVRDGDGKLSYLEGTIRDVTESKILMSKLTQAYKMEAIGTLAGGIAHDFNNILTPIIGYSELSLNLVQDDRLGHNIRQVILAANRAKDLVRQILTFSRKTEQEQKPVQVGLIVKEALKLLRSSLPSTIDIRQNIRDNAIESTSMADPSQIHQVLMNLCTNAAHAMRAQGGTLAVTLENVEISQPDERGSADMEPGAYLRLSVADTGHGMDATVKKRIFDPYFTTKGPNEGTGLGLAVVYGIVKNLHGAISVFSRPGVGTTFHVYFPRTEIIEPPAPDASVPLPRGEGVVLVVDDEKFIVDMIAEMLGILGYGVVPRYSSSDALEAFRARPESFDLVITDLTMPHMTGTDLARKLLKIRNNIPIILCTGFSEHLDENRIKLLGIKAFLMKPVAMRDLAEVVSKTIVQSKQSLPV